MQIEKNISLKSLNTFRLNARCNKLVTIHEEQELPALFSNAIFDDNFMILGGGSNVLFSKDFDGTIIQLRTKGILVIEEDEKQVVLKVAAGEVWDDLVAYAIQHRYHGIENLVTIPGWAGSAPVQNIGAYGVEVKDVIQKVEGISIETGLPVSFHQEACEFDYRSSVFKTTLKNKILITHIYIRLSKKETYTLSYHGIKEELVQQELPLSLENMVKVISLIREKKLPDLQQIGSAGSFFKNPVIAGEQFEKLIATHPQLLSYPWEDGRVKLAAGQLIESCGWKGYRKGDAGIFPQQALIMVNYGMATGEELVALARDIQASVKQKFNIEIEPEVNIV